MARKRSDKLAEGLVDRDGVLRGDRANWDGMWQDIARYVLPREATFTEEVSPGVERQRNVLDSTAPRSLELFASFIHTLMNNPASVWFRPRIAEVRDELNKQVSMQQWRDDVRRRQLQSMTRAKVYSALHQAELNQGAFGTSVVLSEMVNGNYQIRSYHLADCTIDEDESGEVDTVHRWARYTKRQAEMRFPDRAEDLGPSVEKVGDKEACRRKFIFQHSVFPTTDTELMDLMTGRDRRRVEGSPFASVWINHEDRVTIAVSAYQEFPYAVPRWYKVRGERWGRSPAMTVLGDIRMANRMKDTILRGAEKLVDPPLLLPDGGLVSPIRLHAGGLSFTEGTVKVEPLIPPGASRIEFGDALLKQTQEAIRDGFFVPLFITPESPVKTATQVLQEVNERNRAVSPMLVRQQEELHEPLLMRNYNLLSRAGALPPPPEDVGNRPIEVEFISPLSGSQREQEALSILRLFEQIAPWGQIDDGVFDTFHTDRVAEFVSEATGVPAEVKRTATELRTFRAQRAQAEQAAQVAETGPPTAAAAADLIKANAAQTAAERR